MKNIWFLRTDKDNCPKSIDISETNKFIYSEHGVCAKGEKTEEYEKYIFPNLSINNTELRDLIIEIKNKLIKDGKLDINARSKKRCDLFVWYWIAKMSIEDIVFVRNKKQEVFICKITGYVSKTFFKESGSFQRPVEILQKISSNTVDEKIWRRTFGRKTIDRNAKKGIRTLVYNYLEDINFV